MFRCAHLFSIHKSCSKFRGWHWHVMSADIRVDSMVNCRKEQHMYELYMWSHRDDPSAIPIIKKHTKHWKPTVVLVQIVIWGSLLLGHRKLKQKSKNIKRIRKWSLSANLRSKSNNSKPIWLAKVVRNFFVRPLIISTESFAVYSWFGCFFVENIGPVYGFCYKTAIPCCSIAKTDILAQLCSSRYRIITIFALSFLGF